MQGEVVSNTYIAFCGSLVSANVWLAAGRSENGFLYLGMAALALIAHGVAGWKGRKP